MHFKCLKKCYKMLYELLRPCRNRKLVDKEQISIISSPTYIAVGTDLKIILSMPRAFMFPAVVLWFGIGIVT